MKSKTTFTQTVFDAICALLADGESLRKACDLVKGAPDEKTVRNWVRDDVEGCATKYERCRQLGADARFDRIHDLAERALEAKGDSAHVQAIRLLVDTEKWSLARIAPWKYGDKLELTGELKSADAIKAIEFRVVQAPRLEPPTVDGDATEVSNGSLKVSDPT